MKPIRRILSLVLVLCLLMGMAPMLAVSAATSQGTVLLAKDAEWKYEDSGKDLGTDWKNETYNDAAWKKGKAPLGFGDEFSETEPTLALATAVGYGADPANKIMNTYFRSTFTVDKVANYTELEVYVHVDDGAVVYINGSEAFRRGIDVGVPVVYSTPAKFKAKEETFKIPTTLLKDGVNTVTAEVHQDGGDSSDLWFEMSIRGIPAPVLLARDATWKYLDDGKDLGYNWKEVGFDDSSWKTGKAPLGFGDDFSETDPTLPLATTVGFGSDPMKKNMSTYFRTTFNVDGISGMNEVEVYVHVDDGAVVYINGQEAFRRGIETGVAVEYATPAKFKLKEETFRIPAALIRQGLNVVAAEVHQDGGDSSDLWFEMSLSSTTGAVASTPSPTPVVIPDPTAPKGVVSKVTVTFHGDTTSSKGFTWYTTLASGNSDLQVVEMKSETADFSKSISFKGKYALSTNSKTEVVHKAEATGLKADTRYFFRVGDAALNLWSDTGTFTTAAKTGAFTFVNLADSQAKTDDEAKLSSETFDKAWATVKDADFFSINGDIVDVGMVESQWDSVFGHSKNFLLNTTFMAVAGNHDEDKNSFYEHFDIKEAPGSPTATGAYYSFDYSNAHFVGLNNNEDSTEYADFTPAQVNWMKEDIKAAKAAGKTWIIVFMHKGPYTTSNHASDADIGGANGVRTLIAPMFNQLGVDLVLQGHDHIYARTLPVKNGKATQPITITETVNGKSTDYMVNPDGTIYLIPATAGPKVYYKAKDMPSSYFSVFAKADEHAAAIYGPEPSDASRPVRSMIQNFVSFTVDGNKLTAMTYEIDQGKTKQPVLVDQFGITKAAAKTYVIVKGDWLSKIAIKYGISTQALYNANRAIIKNPDLIYAGQVISIP